MTYLEALNLYVMAYTAWSPAGPRLALAISDDLWSWQWPGRVTLAPAL